MKILQVSLANQSSMIYLERGLIAQLKDLPTPKGKGLLLTDQNIPEEVTQMILKQWPIEDVIKLPGNESTKQLDVYEKIITQMLEKPYTRADFIVSLGGGVMGDLAGFVAATYYRGLPFINIPTTLLSMVDASVGGKVALNIGRIKNAVGTFHVPTMVIIDPNLLDTLSKRDYNSGFAEIIKMSLISDFPLFQKLFKDNTIDDIIYDSLCIKKRIVEIDPLDQNHRHLLNYGHTIGHALESLTKGKYSHGECVAMGMKMMARGQSFEKELIALLDKYELNHTIDYQDDALFDAIKNDKKRQGETLNIAFVETLGEGYIKRISYDSMRCFIRKD